MPDTMLLIQMFVLLTVIGGFAGVLAGLLGVGGGIVLVPAFFYAFQTLGYDGPQLMQMCLATSLATIIVTSMRSVLSHNRKGAVDWGILRTWAPGIAIGAVLGVLAAASLRSVTLQALFGVLGIVIGLYLGFGRAHWRLGDAMPGGLRRAVAYGDGWIPIGGRTAVDGRGLSDLRAEACGEAGRDPASLEISIYYAPPDVGIIADLAEHGIERVAFGVPSEGRDAVLQVLDGYAEVMASL